MKAARWLRGDPERGASAVEFAIVASLLFMVLFGTIQFGIAYNRYQGLNAAAREGARIAALQGTTRAEVEQRVKDSLSIIAESAMGNDCSSWTPVDGQGCIDVTTPDGTNLSGLTCDDRPDETVIVLAQYRMEIPIPLWASPEITITGRGEFDCEV